MHVYISFEYAYTQVAVRGETARAPFTNELYYSRYTLGRIYINTAFIAFH